MATDKLSDRLAAYRDYLDHNTRLATLTKSTYLYALRIFIKQVQDCAIADLSPSVLLEWHTSLAKSKRAYSTCNQKRAAVRKFLEYVEEFEENDQAARLLRALDRLEVPGNKKPKREPHVLEEVIRDRLLARAGLHPFTGGRDMAIIQFLWATGVRRAEVASLLLDKVDLEERVATVVGKGNKERLVVFDQQCSKSLDIWLQEREESWPERDGVLTFFIDVNGYPLKPVNVWQIVQTCVKEAGLKGEVWPHLFRHTSITRMAENGTNILEIAAFHGHDNINTTKGYYHPNAGRLKAMYDRMTRGGQDAGDGPD